MNNKSLSSAFLINIMIIGLILVGIVQFSTVQASTEVTGVINSDTTWTQTNSPYILTGPVLVNSSITLTIEPGVTVYLNDTYLRVDGTLNAQGTSTNKISLIRNDTSLVFSPTDRSAIQFTSESAGWNETSKTGSIIENALVSSAQRGSHTISITHSSPKINNCTIIHGGDQRSIAIEGETPIISNNTITGTFAGITVSSSMSSSGGGHITGNIISGCEIGIEVYSGSPIIERNLIINNNGNIMGGSGGIRVDWSGTTPIIRNNTIVKNSLAINIINSASPIIEFNNIYDNNGYSVYLYSGSGSDVNATYNWWGTTDASAINQTIYDFKNDFNLGVVDFVPFLAEINPEAPVVPAFTITASAGDGGSISPSGSVTVTYGDNQTFTVTPDAGYQIATVLMDGAPATAPYTFTNVIADGHTISATFELIPTPTPTPTPSPSPSPTPTPTPTPASTQMSISVDASSTAVGSAVNINGKLSDSKGNPLQDKTVTLSYAIEGDTSWVPIGSGTTNTAGEYSIQWVNTASGTFTLKAEWNGNDEYLGANATTTLSFLPYEKQQLFLLESNSTVSALAFNSTSSELSFTVNGTAETAGYVKVTIAKSLVSNAENIKVYMDGKQLNYEITSNADSWLLSFTYKHSTHHVTISLAANESGSTLLSIESLALIVVVIIIAVAGAVGFVVWRKKKKT